MKQFAINLRPTIAPALNWLWHFVPDYGISAGRSAHLTHTRQDKPDAA